MKAKKVNGQWKQIDNSLNKRIIKREQIKQVVNKPYKISEQIEIERKAENNPDTYKTIKDEKGKIKEIQEIKLKTLESGRNTYREKLPIKKYIYDEKGRLIKIIENKVYYEHMPHANLYRGKLEKEKETIINYDNGSKKTSDYKQVNIAKYENINIPWAQKHRKQQEKKKIEPKTQEQFFNYKGKIKVLNRKTGEVRNPTKQELGQALNYAKLYNNKNKVRENKEYIIDIDGKKLKISEKLYEKIEKEKKEPERKKIDYNDIKKNKLNENWKDDIIKKAFEKKDKNILNDKFKEFKDVIIGAKYSERKKELIELGKKYLKDERYYKKPDNDDFFSLLKSIRGGTTETNLKSGINMKYAITNKDFKENYITAKELKEIINKKMSRLSSYDNIQYNTEKLKELNYTNKIDPKTNEWKGTKEEYNKVMTHINNIKESENKIRNNQKKIYQNIFGKENRIFDKALKSFIFKSETDSLIKSHEVLIGLRLLSAIKLGKLAKTALTTYTTYKTFNEYEKGNYASSTVNGGLSVLNAISLIKGQHNSFKNKETKINKDEISNAGWIKNAKTGKFEPYKLKIDKTPTKTNIKFSWKDSKLGKWITKKQELIDSNKLLNFIKAVNNGVKKENVLKLSSTKAVNPYDVHNAKYELSKVFGELRTIPDKDVISPKDFEAVKELIIGAQALKDSNIILKRTIDFTKTTKNIPTESKEYLQEQWLKQPIEMGGSISQLDKEYTNNHLNYLKRKGIITNEELNQYKLANDMDMIIKGVTKQLIKPKKHNIRQFEIDENEINKALLTSALNVSKLNKKFINKKILKKSENILKKVGINIEEIPEFHKIAMQNVAKYAIKNPKLIRNFIMTGSFLQKAMISKLAKETNSLKAKEIMDKEKELLKINEEGKIDIKDIDYKSMNKKINSIEIINNIKQDFNRLMNGKSMIATKIINVNKNLLKVVPLDLETGKPLKQTWLKIFKVKDININEISKSKNGKRFILNRLKVPSITINGKNYEIINRHGKVGDSLFDIGERDKLQFLRFKENISNLIDKSKRPNIKYEDTIVGKGQRLKNVLKDFKEIIEDKSKTKKVTGVLHSLSKIKINDKPLIKGDFNIKRQETQESPEGFGHATAYKLSRKGVKDVEFKQDLVSKFTQEDKPVADIMGKEYGLLMSEFDLNENPKLTGKLQELVKIGIRAVQSKNNPEYIRRYLDQHKNMIERLRQIKNKSKKQIRLMNMFTNSYIKMKGYLLENKDLGQTNRIQDFIQKITPFNIKALKREVEAGTKLREYSRKELGTYKELYNKINKLKQDNEQINELIKNKLNQLKNINNKKELKEDFNKNKIKELIRNINNKKRIINKKTEQEINKKIKETLKKDENIKKIKEKIKKTIEEEIQSNSYKEKVKKMYKKVKYLNKKYKNIPSIGLYYKYMKNEYKEPYYKNYNKTDYKKTPYIKTNIITSKTPAYPKKPLYPKRPVYTKTPKYPYIPRMGEIIKNISIISPPNTKEYYGSKSYGAINEEKEKIKNKKKKYRQRIKRFQDPYYRFTGKHSYGMDINKLLRERYGNIRA